MRPTSILAALTVFLAIFLPAQSSTELSAAAALPSVSPSLDLLHRLPVAFELNRGQLDGRVRFTAQAGGATLFLTETEAVIATVQSSSQPGLGALSPAIQLQEAVRAGRTPAPATETVVRLHPLGARSHPALAAQQRLPGVINEYIGNDPRHWQTGIPAYALVTYHDVYPGIDLAYHGAGSQLEYDWIVHRGVNPARIRLAVSGPGHPALGSDGSLRLAGSGMRLVMQAPHVYAMLNGNRFPVSGRFVLSAGHILSLRVGRYDRRATLVVDPTITTTKATTYFGGTGDEHVTGVKIDSKHNTVIVGDATSATFPSGSKTSFQSPAVGDTNMYVASINSGLGAFRWITRIGGKTAAIKTIPPRTFGDTLALGRSDSVYAAGSTTALDIPLLSPFQKAIVSYTGYLVRLSSAGRLQLASTVGGATGLDSVAQLALDRSSGDLFLGMVTSSRDLPAHPGVLQPAYPNVPCPTGQGTATVPCLSGFLMRITGIGKGRKPVEVNGTYIGGTTAGDTFIHDLAVGSSHKVYVVGSTAASALPVTPGAYQATPPTVLQNPYVAVFPPSLAAASSYLSFTNPGKAVANGGSLAVDKTDMIVGVNVYLPAANNTTKVTAIISDWPLGPTGSPSGKPVFAFLGPLHGIAASVFSTYIADSVFVRSWKSSGNGFGLKGKPLELSENYIATAGGVAVAFEGVVLVNKHIVVPSGIAPIILNGGGKNDLAGPIDSMYSAPAGWHTRLGVMVQGPVNGFLSSSGSTAQSRTVNLSSPAAAAQSSYSGGLDGYVLRIERKSPAAPAQACPANSAKVKGTCTCKKGYVMQKGKCVKKK